jgi:replicative DNA helicase
VKSLLYNEEYARKVYPFLKSDYFDGASKEIYNLYCEIFDKYKKIPSMESMVVSLQGKKLNESIFQESIDFLQSIYKNRKEIPDTDWLFDETEKYCIDKATYNALYQSISIIEGNDEKLDKHAIPKIMEEALSISFNTSIGSDYFEDFEKRYEYYTNVENRVQFALKALNILSNGGLPSKTLNAFIAGPNVGKSSLLCFQAGEWLKAGKNVLYITLEMSEEAIQERIDANVLDMTTDELKNPKLNFEIFKSKLQKIKERTVGKLIVKEYPTGQGHSGHFRHLLKELKVKKKFEPDIVIVDYINICASAKYRNSSSANSYTVVKSIAEELRGLAVEFDVPFLTATQVNRDGMNKQNPDMSSTSESIGLPQTLDWFVAIVSNEELNEMGRQLLLLLKSRYGNKKKVKNQLIRVDFDKMRYFDVNLKNESEEKEMINTINTSKPSFGDKPKIKSGIPDNIDWE